MFTFFHRKKTIIVDCFITDPFAYKYTPIVRGTKSYPDWWKNIPVEKNFDAKNMKNCYGFIELHKNSFILENWADINYRVTKNEGYRYSGSSGINASEHPADQRGYGFSDYYHSKMISPWRFRTSSNIKFSFIPACWHHENYANVTIPPGIVEFKHQSSTNVNLLFVKGDYNFFIPAGLPLVHYVPMTEDNVQFRNHLVSEAEFKKYSNHSGIGIKGLKGLISLGNRNEERNKSKCPFGHNANK